MPLPRHLALWPGLLRVLLAAAILALVPLAEAAHARPDRPAQAMQMPCDHKSHGDGLACRILCLGWVQAIGSPKPAAPIRLARATVPAPPVELTAGLGPSPRGRPPKTLLSA